MTICGRGTPLARELLSTFDEEERGERMVTASDLFEVERSGQTLIVTPRHNLSELEWPAIDAGMVEVLELLSNGTIQNVVLDFHRTDYYGSTALGYFLKLWKRVREVKGRLAFCRLSTHQREILQVAGLDRLWPVCASREEALQAIRAGHAVPGRD
jgi:anti-anti-sigma factor